MSDEHEPRRRSRGATPWLTYLGWGVAVFLAANLVWGKLREEGGRPQGFLSEKLVLTIAFWAPLAVAGASAVAGALWTQKTYARRQKSSLLWTRNAFTAAGVAALLLAVAAMDPRRFTREWLAAWSAGLLAAVVGCFAYAAFREHRRASGGGGGRHSRSGDGDDE